MISVKELNVSYHDKKILDNLSFTIASAGIIGILGPNGAGKSTLMKAMLGLIKFSGEVTICEKNYPQKQAVAYMEQRSVIDVNFPITVAECVALGTYGRLGLCHRVNKMEEGKVNHYLKQVGLASYANQPISGLSGGQFQRMLLARCLIQETDYLFLDEPFVGIDSVSECIIIRLLKDLKNSGKTIVIVHHDLSKVVEYFDQILLLNQTIKAFGSVEQVFKPEFLEETYGQTIVVKGE